MKKFYMASDLFTEERRNMIDRYAETLRKLGDEVYVPHEHTISNGAGLPNNVWASAVFYEDIRAIENCTDLIYFCEGMSGDIGAAFECGYAYARGKQIRVIETGLDDSGKISLMVGQASNTPIVLYQS